MLCYGNVAVVCVAGAIGAEADSGGVVGSEDYEMRVASADPVVGLTEYAGVEVVTVP